MPASSTPTVSVVIPTHNRSDLLPRAIRSVFAQTFQDWEVIVVDDGSTDDTAAVVRSFRDERVRYVKLERNSGPSRARNVGIDGARGRYLAFLDSDDEYLPHKLETQLRQFQTNPYKLARLGVVLGHRRVQGGQSASARARRLRPLRGDVRPAVFGAGRSSAIGTAPGRPCWCAVNAFERSAGSTSNCMRRSGGTSVRDCRGLQSSTTSSHQWRSTGNTMGAEPGPATGESPRRRYLLTSNQRDIPSRRRHQSHLLLVMGVLELQRQRANVALRHLARSFVLWPRAKAVWFFSLAVWRTVQDRKGLC